MKKIMIVSLAVTLAILVIAPFNQVSADNYEVIPKRYFHNKNELTWCWRLVKQNSNVQNLLGWRFLIVFLYIFTNLKFE